MSEPATCPRFPERGDVFDSSCPSRSVLEHVTSKWAVLVVVALQDAPLRFSALRRVIGGVSEKMLAQSLRTLQADGLILREVVPTTPPQVSYRLSELGREGSEHLLGLLDWIERRIPEIVEVRRGSVSGNRATRVPDGS